MTVKLTGKVNSIRCRWIFLFVAFAQATSLPASAHDSGSTYSLSAAIEQAKNESPERVALVSRRDATLAKKRQALAPAQPSFTLGIGDLAAQPGPENSRLRTYQITQALGFPGKAHTASQSFELEASSIEQQIAAKDIEIVRQVKVAFFQLWLAEQKATLNDTKRSSFQKILEVAKRRLVKDTTSEVEYLAAQTALAKIENESADVTASERSFRARLNSLLGRPPEAQITVAAPPFSERQTPIDADALRKRFLKSNATLLATRFRLESAGSRVSEARWAYLPDFKFSAGVNSFNAYAGSVELSLPFWFWWNEQSGVSAASAARAAEQADYTAQERSLLSSLEEKLITLNALQSKLRTYTQVLVPNSQKAFEVALKNYRFGKIEFATLTGAAENQVSSRLEYDSLLADFEIARAETEELVGGSFP